MGISKRELFQDPSLGEILLYHMVPGEYLSSDLVHGRTLRTEHKVHPLVNKRRDATRSLPMSER